MTFEFTALAEPLSLTSDPDMSTENVIKSSGTTLESSPGLFKVPNSVNSAVVPS